MEELKNSNKILLCVRAMITDTQDRILLIKRDTLRSYNPDKWELPGGKIGPEEDIDKALERIIFQECELFVKFIPDKCYIHSRLVNEEGKYKGYSYFEIAIPAIYLSGTVNVLKGETSDFKWAKKEDVLDMDITFESRKNLTKYLYEANGKSSELSVIVVSRALIVNEKEEVLLLKRSSSDKYPDVWELPGGKLSDFESLTDHLIREVLEETGFIIKILNPHVYVHSFIPTSGSYRGKTFINIINVSTIKSGKLRLSPEHSDYAWVNKSKILDYDMPDYMNHSITELFSTFTIKPAKKTSDSQH